MYVYAILILLFPNEWYDFDMNHSFMESNFSKSGLLKSFDIFKK